MKPNDIIISLTSQPDGKITYEIIIGVNDEAMLPELERAASFLHNCMAIYNKSPAEIEYAEVLAYTDKLAKKPKLALVGLDGEIIVEH